MRQEKFRLSLVMWLVEKSVSFPSSVWHICPLAKNVSSICSVSRLVLFEKYCKIMAPVVNKLTWLGESNSIGRLQNLKMLISKRYLDGQYMYFGIFRSQRNHVFRNYYILRILYFTLKIPLFENENSLTKYVRFIKNWLVRWSFWKGNPWKVREGD